MSNIQFQLTSDNSQFLQGIAQADNAQKALSKGAKQFGDDSKKAYNEAGKGAEGFGNETKKTEEKTKSLKAQLRELKAEIANATDPDEMAKLAKQAGELEDKISSASKAASSFASGSPFVIIGNQMGDVISKIRNLDFGSALDSSRLLVSASKSLTFKEGIKGVKDLGSTLLNMGKALLMNPIFLLGTAITLIIANFDKLKNAGGLVGDTFKSIGKAVEIVLDLGKDFLTFIKLIDSTKKSLDDIIKSNEAVMANINARYDLEIAKAKLAGKQTEDLEISKAKVAIYNQQYLLNATRERYRIGEIDAKEYTEKLLKIGQDSNKASIDLINAEANAKQKAKEKQQKANDDYKKNQEAFNAALLDLFKKAQQAELDGLSGQEKIEMQKKIAEQELQQLKDTVIKKQIEAGKGNKLSVEQEQEFSKLKTAINREYYYNILQLAIESAQKEANINKLKNDTLLQTLELRYSIAKNNIEAIRANENASEAEKLVVEEERKKVLLQVELQYQKDKLQLVLNQIDLEKKVKESTLKVELEYLKTKEDTISKARIEAINNELSAISLNAELSKQAAISATDNIIAGINDQLISNKPKKLNFAKLLGLDDQELSIVLNAKLNTKIDPKDIANTKQAITQLVGYLNEIMTAYFKGEQDRLDKELSDNKVRIDERNKNIENLQSQLNTEKMLQDKGLANNVDRINKAILEQEQARQRDLENDKKIKEEKKKLAKQQLDIDTATQASSLLVAAAQIYESYASIPYVGQALAAVVIAAMFGAFYSTKQQAYENLNNSNSFAKGVVGLKGPGTETSDDIQANLSVNESVITAKGTRKSSTLLKGLNADDNKTITKGIAELLKNTGVSIEDVATQINGSRNNLRQAELNSIFMVDNSKLESGIRELNNEFKKTNRALNESKTVLPNGDIIIKSGSLTRIIKNKK